MGYGLTYPACQFISAAAPWLVDTAPEDGVMARWLLAIGVKFVTSDAWRAMDGSMPDRGPPCDEGMVLTHKMPNEWWSRIAANGMLEC